MNDKWLAIMWIGIVFSICVTVLTAIYLDVQSTKVWTSAGYEQDIVPGSQYYKWQKIREND